MVLRPEHIQVEVVEPGITQQCKRLHEVCEPFNGHHARNKHEPPHVPATLRQDARPGSLTPHIRRVHALDEHTVRQHDRAVFFTLVVLVDGRTDAARLLNRLGVQIGHHIGAGVAETSHFQEPDAPRSLFERDGTQLGFIARLLQEGVIRGDGLGHIAFQLGVDSIAHIQVVFGQQEAGAVIARTRSAQK